MQYLALIPTDTYKQFSLHCCIHMTTRAICGRKSNDAGLDAITNTYVVSVKCWKLPNQELSGAKSELQGETVGVCSSYKRGGQPPYSSSLRNLQFVLTCAYIVSEASTNNKYEGEMHIEARRIIFLSLLQ